MKCFPKRLIYIKINFFLYLVECNVVRINVFTLELCLLLFLMIMVSRIISEIERNMQNQHRIANYPLEFSFFSWIGSFRNKPFSLDFNQKAFVPFLSLVKNTEYNV